jgi:tRNA uracil 4-sulfurtransferase
MKYDVLIIRYGELSLKSSYVRKQFESRLIHNIKTAFNEEHLPCSVSSERGRIYVYSENTGRSIEILKKIFGIKSISPAITTTSDINDMSEYAVKIAKQYLTKEKSFALKVTRTGSHTYSSQDIAISVGSLINQQTQASVDLSHPDFQLFIEIRNQNAYFFIEKNPGPGGLPYGTQGSALCLISNPKDIVAAWFLMKRGCQITFALLNSHYYEMLLSFTKNWYIHADIYVFEKNNQVSHFLHDILKTKTFDVFITGHTFSVDDADIIKDITDLKHNYSIVVLHPLIAMQSEEISTMGKKIGISV